MAITLKAARINAGLTQPEAAKILEVSVNTLSSYEAERTYPDAKIIKDMEKLYSIKFADIFFNTI